MSGSMEGAGHLSKGRLFNGMYPTGRLHLGNYRWKRFAKDTDLLEEIRVNAAEKARTKAEKKMEIVRKAVRL